MEQDKWGAAAMEERRKADEAFKAGQAEGPMAGKREM